MPRLCELTLGCARHLLIIGNPSYYGWNEVLRRFWGGELARVLRAAVLFARNPANQFRMRKVPSRRRRTNAASAAHRLTPETLPLV